MFSRLGKAVAVAVVPVLTACYTYVPVDTSASPPPPGKRVAFDITDQGRVALGDRLGSSVLRLEGTVTSTDSSQYMVNVWQVAQIDGQRTQWAGERIRLNRNFVGGVFERRLSRSRTYLAAGIAVVGFVAVAGSQGLFGNADVQSATEEPPPQGTSNRVPW